MSTEPAVYVIDDDEAARDSIAFLLETARLPVRTFESAAAFLAQPTPPETGCIITDVRMPEVDGIELLRRLRAQGNRLPVIVITGHGDVPLAVEAMKIGAIDFFEKPFDDEALLSAVRAALGRRQGEDEREAEKRMLAERFAALSAREKQVLEGLVKGHQNKVIAFDLGISPRTVEIYRANVMTKSQASSLSDLVRMALIAGVVTS